MGPLDDLRIAPLRLFIETLGGFHAPEYKGALLRGGFGHFFRDLVCVTRMPICTGCPHLETCPYSLIFETPVLPGKFAVLRKYPNAPHPFVLAPPSDARAEVPAGSEMSLELTLIGRGLDYLPHFISVFDAMGRSGRYGGRFHLKMIVPGGTEAEGRPAGASSPALIYDGATRRMVNTPPLWRPSPEPAPVRRLRLEFVTPLRMRTGGRYNARPDFVALTKTLLRRIHLLAAVYGSGNGDASWTHPLLKIADRAVTERADFSLFRWSRTSGRQQRAIDMDGVLGTLEATGDLTPLAPYLRAGVWLHVGSGTSMGMGRYGLYA